jgi:hypothetical protein
MGNNIMMPVLLFLQITRMHYLHPKVVDLISQPKTWYYAQQWLILIANV